MITTLPTDFTLENKMLRAVDVPHSVYIHVPFCHHRCAYCDFNIYADQPALYEAYVHAIAEEIAATAIRVGRVRVPTIYFGGGTPSRLPAELIGGLLAAVRTFFEVDEDAEITLEANPMTDRRMTVDDGRHLLSSAVVRPSSLAYFAHLRDLGVNR